jgi:peptidoglycan/LPS O-acetylase OafA/YrhL
MRGGTNHVPVLDGLRGLAILMVLVAHFSGESLLDRYYPHLGPVLTKVALMGLMGVDLFFVLSGFLITGILLDSRGRHGYFKNFYVRRFLRIFPLYYFVLVVVFFVGPHFIRYDPAAQEILRHQGWMWAYLCNLPTGVNWDGSQVFMLGHFWSLAVEEQFYFLWPAVVLLANRERLARVCLAWAGGSWVVLALGYLVSGELGHVIAWIPLSHTGGLALGSYCAAVARRDRDERSASGLQALGRQARLGMGLFGALFVGLSFVPRSTLPHPEQNLLVPVAALMFTSMLVLALAAPKGGILNRTLSNRALGFTGKISYGLYVYHGLLRPAFEKVFPRQALIDALGWPALGMLAYFILAVGCSYLVAWASWGLLEKRILRLKSKFEYGS